MIRTGAFDAKTLGNMSSVFFAMYGIGQLINGILGERVRIQYMAGGGLLCSALCIMVLLLSRSPAVVIPVWGLFGLALAMLYGPIVKTVSENMSETAIRFTMVFISFSAYAGVSLSGFAAAFFPTWQGAFLSSAVFLAILGIASLVLFPVMEHKGWISFKREKTEQIPAKEFIRQMLKYGVVFMGIVTALTGTVRNAVLFWMPTYMIEYLTFPPETAAVLFSSITLVQMSSKLLALLLYRLFRQNIYRMTTVMFLISGISFLGMFKFSHAWVNLCFFVVVILATYCIETLTWVVYCPGFRTVGKVSVVTGLLDSISYLGATIANLVFSNASVSIGWRNMILIWTGIMFTGFTAGFIFSYVIRIKLPHAECEQPASAHKLEE